MKIYKILLITSFAYFLISCGGAEERKAVYMEKANVSIEAGDYAKARIELKNVLQIDPKDGMAHYLLGKVFEKQKEYRKAYREYIKAEELSPDLLINHAQLGRFYLLLMNSPEKAQEKIDFILTKDATNADGLLLKAAVEVKNKDNMQAMKIVEDILTRDSEHIDSIMFLATLHMSEERFNDAIEVLDRAITAENDNEEVNRLLASALMSEKEYDRAELIYQNFLERNPDVASSYTNLAAFYDATGDIEKAEEMLRTSYVNKPDDKDRQSTLIHYIKDKKGNDSAIKALEGYISEYNDNGNLRLALAEMHILNGHKQTAIEVYTSIVNDYSEDDVGVSARISLAGMYISDKDYVRATEIVKEALAVSPNDPDVNFLNAKLAIHNKDYEKAIISLRIVTKETPENIEAFILLAAIYKEEGSEDKVNSTLTNAHELNISNAGALMMLAQYQLNRDINQAEKIIDDYNALKENDYEGLSIKAAILNKNKLYDQAFEIANDLMELFPDKPNGYLQAVSYYGQTSDTKMAISVLEKGYMNAEDNLGILRILTEAQTQEKQYDVVINRIEAEIKKSPDNDELKLLLAKVYIIKEDNSSAIKLLTEVTENKSSLEESYLVLSLLHNAENNSKASKAVLIAGKANVASSVKIPLTLASIYEKEDDYKSAIDVYRDLNELHSNNLIVLNNYASLLSDYGNGGSDLKLAQQLALKLEKSNQPVFLDTVGWVHYKMGDFDNAVQYLTQAVEKAPKINVFNYHLGMAYIGIGDKVNAKIFLENSLSDGKDFKEKDAAKVALNKL